MTRVNANLDPKLLKRMHLIAELREITMVPAALRRSLRTKTTDDILASIPSKFTLNAGHVKFFYNKMEFLKKRFASLCNEMNRRGYDADRTRINAFHGFDSIWYNDWQSSNEDTSIILERINQKIAMKPHLYRD